MGPEGSNASHHRPSASLSLDIKTLQSNGEPSGASPRTPVYANWATSPLVPRKSPERFNKRLALGHKTTQSLNIPRNTDLALTLEALLKPATKPALTIETSSTNTDLASAIVSPRPRRVQDVAHRLEQSPLTTSNTPEVSPSLPAQPAIEQTLQKWKLEPPKGRRHVRGARSMSPQRTHPLCSPQEFVTASQHDALHTPPAPVMMQNAQNGQMPLSPTHRASPSVSPATFTVPSVEAITEELRDTHLSEPQVLSTEAACVLSEEDAINTLVVRKETFDTASIESQITWAEQVLRLTDRHRLRQGQLTGTAQPSLPLLLYELEQEALELIRTASTPSATFLLGLLHEFGKNTLPLDRQAAFKLFKQAATAGLARADYRLGMQFEKVGEMRRACACYERGAAKDDAACLYRLGMMLLFGQHGYALDPTKGVQCLHLAALRADAEAPLGAFVFGLLLAGETKFKVDAEILQPDETRALAYIQKAATLGSPGAQVRLGKAYERSELGLPFDPALSLHYHLLGALGGDPEADLALSKWFLAGSDDGIIAKDEDRAFRHSKLAAQRGLPAAEFALGYLYEIGVGCAVDLLEARAWYTCAAGHGDGDAVARLEGLARQKTLSRRDHEHHVAVQIKARHATLKLNSQVAARYRHRSTPSLPVTSMTPAATAPVVTATTFAAPRRAPPIPQMSLTETAEMLAPRSPQRSPQMQAQAFGHEHHQGQQRVDGTPESSPTRPLRYRAPALHRRGQSWAPPAPPAQWQPEEASASSQETSRPVEPFLIRLPHAQGQQQTAYVLPRQDAPVAAEMAAEDAHAQDAVRAWTFSDARDPFARHSLMSASTPATAPASEAGSALEAVMAARGSPRPESSISNVAPSTRRVAALASLARGTVPAAAAVALPGSGSASVPGMRSGSTLEEVQHGRRGFALSDDGAAPGTPVVVTQTGNSAAGSGASAAAVVKRGGPATFEEMGIPLENKKDADCLIM